MQPEIRMRQLARQPRANRQNRNSVGAPTHTPPRTERECWRGVRQRTLPFRAGASCRVYNRPPAQLLLGVHDG